MSNPRNAVNHVERALRLGFTLPEALSAALGRPLAEFARENGYRESEVSMCLRAYRGRVYGTIRDSLAGELGVRRRDVDRLISKAPRVGA